MHPNIALGKYGEELAAKHLEASGCVILDRNWRCRHGELDIVARDGDELVVCEVKTRNGDRFGSPLEAITARKLRTLRTLALAWIAERGMNTRTIRLDIIGVTPSAADGTIIHHIRGVS